MSFAGAMPTPRAVPRIPSDLCHGSDVVAIGDSITGNVVFNQASAADFIPAPRGSWFTYLTWRSQGRIRHTRFANRGISGNTTTQMLARFATEVIAQNPAFVIIAGGTNDTLSGSMAVTQGNVQAMVALAKAARIQPILWTIPPASGRTANEMTAVDTYNRWLLGYAAANGFPVIDAYRAVIDPASNGLQAAYNSGDTLHPNNAGSLAIADRAIADGILNLFPVAPAPLHHRTNGAGINLVPNGLFVGDANVDGIADGWSVRGSISGGGTLTASLVADASALGNWQRLVVTSTGGKVAAYQTANIATGWAVGDRLALLGLIETSACVAGGLGAQVYAAFTGPATPAKAWAVHNQQVDISPSVFYVDFTVPPLTTAINVAFGVITNAGDGLGTLKVGQLTLLNLTTLGLG